MKISIITVCYNSSRTIARAIESVLSQNDIELEYIIVDGKSTDDTAAIIDSYAKSNFCIRWISEKDNGIYDAMNKGIAMCSGEIIGILNSDDFYANNLVLSKVCSAFIENRELDSCYGNLLYVKTNDVNTEPYRYWRSGRRRSFKYGWMPPHPAFFVRKEVYNKYGNFRLDCGTAADYEFMLRILERHRISSKWIDSIITYMEAGGASGASLEAYKKSTENDVKAWNINNIKPVHGFKYLKKLRKIKQFITARFVNIPDV